LKEKGEEHKNLRCSPKVLAKMLDLILQLGWIQARIFRKAEVGKNFKMIMKFGFLFLREKY